MTGNLAGRRAIVTGASGGIGRAIAEQLAGSGAEVIVHYAGGADRAEAAVQAITDAGGQASAMQADLGDLASIAAFAQACGTIDILVNNAGVARGGSIAITSAEDYDAMMGINVRGLFFLTQALLPQIRDGGAIVNISSMVSIVAYPTTISYAMSKAAVNAFTRSLAADLGPRRIRVNAVAPGGTDTAFLSQAKEMPGFVDAISSVTAFGRLGEPAEIARVVEFLASPSGAWITGQVIQASGGMHL